MAKDETPIEGAENEEQQQQSKKGNERPAGAPEGKVEAEPSANEIKELYEATGVKAPVPTGKPKGRPKTSDVRAKDDKKNASGNSNSGSEEKDDDDKSKSKNAPASSKDGDSGGKADSKGSKDSKATGKVQDESGDSDEGVRDSESAGKSDSERGREEDSEQRTERTGQEAHDEGSEAEEEGDDEKNNEVKRPGKSNPEVEKRMQRLAAERKEALERAEKAEKALQETTRKQAQERVAQEDPEYTIQDFKKVRDNKTGEIKELNDEEAELAWRRWKDGYDQRATERQARENYEAERVERAEATTRQLMKDSADAYDAIAGLMDEFPELVEKFPDGTVNENFDEDFATDALPIIQEAIEYLPGTEPGNPNDKLPVIVGLKIDPKKILKAFKGISNKKRSLPLNGVNDNVESRSNVAVPHSRSSDPAVNAANELYQELGIKKRI